MRNRFIPRLWITVIIAAGLTGVPASNSRAQESCPIGQFRAQYSKNGKRVFAKCEARIDFNWGTSGPKRGGDADGKSDNPGSLAVGTDDFQVQWNGRFNFTGGNYTFIVVADDGVRLRVDGQLLIDQWRAQGATEFRATKNLTPGAHTVAVDYFEDKNAATIKVRWVKSGS